MTNIFDSLKQLSQVKHQAAKFQKILADKIIDVSSPGNEIKLKVNGKMEILKIEISPEILKPEKKEEIEKLFLKTWALAKKEIEKVIASELKSQLGGDFPL